MFNKIEDLEEQVLERARQAINSIDERVRIIALHYDFETGELDVTYDTNCRLAVAS